MSKYSYTSSCFILLFSFSGRTRSKQRKWRNRKKKNKKQKTEKINRVSRFGR